MKSTGFRRVPTWVFLRQIEERRERGEPLSIIEAWCSLDYDLFRHNRIASERAYAKLWRRNRGWVRHVMQWFREERDLPAPRVGRRPNPRHVPRPNGGLPTAPNYHQAISETKS